MKIINRPRGTGKTTQLIYLSECTGVPIVSYNPEYIIALANKMGCKIPKPLNVSEFSRELGGVRNYYIDDLDTVLPYILVNVPIATTSWGMEKQEEDKYDSD